MFKLLLLSCLLLGFFHSSKSQCATPSPTTASGTHAPTSEICSGDLIFEDNFDDFNLQKWNHEITVGGGGVSTTVSHRAFALTVGTYFNK